jgi:citrate lyase subunit beta/citryl-CoA lyase
MLSVPVNIPKFVDKAHLRGADAIMLDVEDAVPLAEKEKARTLIKEAIPLVARGGAEVTVRINKDLSLISDDVDASVNPGLNGIVLPKTETPEDVHNLEHQVEKLEVDRGISKGEIKFHILIETPRGLLNVEDIAGSSNRIFSMAIGMEDYCMELGVEPSADGMEIFYAVSRIVTVCKAIGIKPLGLLGSIGNFGDLEGFEKSAVRARQIGCEGAACIHPGQVAVLNRVFSPAEDKIAYAKRVVQAFKDGVNSGTASVNVDGKMVDIPIYHRAKATIEKYDAIQALEQNKAEMLAKL